MAGQIQRQTLKTSPTDVMNTLHPLPASNGVFDEGEPAATFQDCHLLFTSFYPEQARCFSIPLLMA